ncbi:hypothetical protein [Streptomyces sp. KM273126]|nr:hypothetical protein [Streptomyces sp. KM273126]
MRSSPRAGACCTGRHGPSNAELVEEWVVAVAAERRIEVVEAA